MTAKYILPRLRIFLRQYNTANNSLGTFIVENGNTRYQDSKIIGPAEEYNSKFEVTNDPEDWKYVERILAPLIVPVPKEKQEYVSGWKPQPDSELKENYFVARTKNFMMPVYLNATHRGMRKITKINKIQGDVFKLEKDLKTHLESSLNKDVAIQANELVGYIRIKGDYVSLVKDFLTKKGF